MIYAIIALKVCSYLLILTLLALLSLLSLLSLLLHGLSLDVHRKVVVVRLRPRIPQLPKLLTGQAAVAVALETTRAVGAALHAQVLVCARLQHRERRHRRSRTARRESPQYDSPLCERARPDLQAVAPAARPLR